MVWLVIEQSLFACPGEPLANGGWGGTHPLGDDLLGEAEASEFGGALDVALDGDAFGEDFHGACPWLTPSGRGRRA